MFAMLIPALPEKAWHGELPETFGTGHRVAKG
jgi:hypothetical protein